MKNSYLFILFVLSSLLLSSCKQSSDVVSDNWLQKRKHRKGFHLDLAKHKKQESTFKLSADLPTLGGKSDSLTQPKIEVGTLISAKKRAHSHTTILRKTFTKPKILQNVERRLEQRLSQDDEEPPGQQEKVRSSKNGLIGSIVATVFSLALLGLGISLLLSSIGAPIILGALVIYITAHALPVSIILLIANIKEHLALKRGGQFLTEERRERFRKTAKTWSLIMLLGGLIFLFLGAVILYLVLFGIIDELALSILGLLAIFLTVAYWIAISSHALSRGKSFMEIAKLIFLAIYPAIIAVLSVLITIIMIIFALATEQS